MATSEQSSPAQPAASRPSPPSNALPDAAERLAALERRVREDIEVTSHSRNWIPRADGETLDVLVIGGGQAGLAVAFGLQRERIDRVLVVDDGPAARVGCWDRYARMHTLRSPKHMKGIELDVPSLHVQRWFEAVYGQEAWEAITLVPRLDWNDYLRWYRDVTGVRVEHETRVVAVHRPSESDGAFEVELRDAHATEGAPTRTVTARRIVFALGLDGGGGPQIPGFVSALPKERWFHTEEDIDFEAFRGKRVAVLGGGASGFDNAGTALELGAAKADVFMRRDEVPNKNPLRWMEFPGMQEHYYDLTDEQKWEFSVFNGGLPQPPTQHTIWRCFAQAGFTLHRGRGWDGVEVVRGDDGLEELLIHTPTGEHRADVIIAATGYRINLHDRPELEEFVEDIALWSDRFAPSAGHPMGASPYLGTGFEFQPKSGERAPWVERLHHFSTGARPSMGVTGNQLSGIYGGVKRMTWSIATSVTQENWPTLMNDFRDFEHIEITSVGPHTEADGWFPPGPRY